MLSPPTLSFNPSIPNPDLMLNAERTDSKTVRQNPKAQQKPSKALELCQGLGALWFQVVRLRAFV